MNRHRASVAAAVLAAGASLLCTPAASAGTAAPAGVQPVTAADLGPARPWIRLEDDPTNAGRTPGSEEVSPFADPVHSDGSLHLAVGPGRQSQAAHYFAEQIPLATLAQSPLAYDSYVDGAHSTATGTAAGLQLPMICRGVLTTLSFQPQLATDSRGRSGVVPDVWQHFASTGSSLWRTSRALPTSPAVPAGGDAPLSTYASGCTAVGDGVLGVVANAGGLDDASATLDAHVDNVAAGGTVWNFRVARRATAGIALRGSVSHCGAHNWHCYPSAWDSGTPGSFSGSTDWHSRSAAGPVTFTDPADGPLYRAVGTRLVLGARRTLSPDDLSVTANGAPVALTAGPDGTLVGVAAAAPGADLAPGGTYRTSVAVTFAGRWSGPGAGRRDLTLSTELLARGSEPLQRTGVVARTTLLK